MTPNKMLTLLLPCFLLFSLLIGCSNANSPVSHTATATDSGENPPASDVPGTNGTAVGFLFVGATDDFGYNQAIYQSTVAAEKAFPDLHIIRKENVPENSDSEKVMEDMIKSGAKIMFPLSNGYLETAMKVAERHPDVVFFIPGGDKTLPNLGDYTFSFWKEMYMMGVVAGKQSKSGKTGFVVAFPANRILLQVNAFTVGLRSVQPNATTKVIFTNNWCDPMKQADAANELMDEGIDVITQVQNCTKTIHQIAEKRGVNTIGYHVDGSSIAPNSWLSGLVFDRSKLFIDMIETTKEGRFKGSRYDGSLIVKNDVDKFMQLASFGNNVSEDVRRLIKTQLKDIQSGALSPLRGPVKDQSGTIRIAEGTSPTEEVLSKTNYFVDGVIGEIPKKQ
ncbi:BMP family ABC transporter substrate-binding protein [Cohnella silvisoli]|uniref:BMP family ABC transporter substrate-binding protein n=1 Tax=Cohnella silvisoli TaxID=2873699 RepID=A0ABV1KQT7_9BACL|nr:BMP family ABC transporter substrate-binding protein [Cohnella silvisoli]MCD9024604.1 BMP family ABC transporter substrate-binding protein [Cohnella silvisoli]